MYRFLHEGILFLGLSLPLSAANYTFTSIDYPGADATRAYGISAEGFIVGSFDDSDGTHGFVMQSGHFTPLDFPGAVETDARSINVRGEIVGFYFDTNFNLHGFYFHKGHFKPVEIPFSIETRAEGINDAGVISGEYVDVGGNEHGFLLRDQEFTSFDIPNSDSTDIWMIANDGDFAGDYDIGGTVLGFLEIKGHSPLTLNFPGSADTAPRSLNDSGVVVGRWDDHSTPVQLFCTTQCHGFLWQKGRFHSFDFPGAVSSFAMGINDCGWIVGRYDDSSGVTHGYLARPND